LSCQDFERRDVLRVFLDADGGHVINVDAAFHELDGVILVVL
jgi:hypothetical protein